jgi:hypothetical protein
VAPCGGVVGCRQDGGSMVLRNVGILPEHCTENSSEDHVLDKDACWEVCSDLNKAD